MTWAYNEIDVYVTETDNILGETSIDTTSSNALWVSLSTYGILRGRPTLTSSTFEGDSVTIKMRDGRPMAIDKSRKNAKLEFEILVADTWTFADRTDTVWDRINILQTLLNTAKRVSYKEPGKSNTFYYLVYNTSVTITDADEKAAAVKVSMDIHPFEFFLSGNRKLTVPSNGYLEVANLLPKSQCMPTFSVTGTGMIAIAEGNDILGSVSCETAPAATILDTFIGIAWTIVGGEVVNANQCFSGDYETLWLPANRTLRVVNTFANDIYIYTREGIVR